MKSAVLLLALLSLQPALFASDVRPVRMRWDDAAQLVRGRQATVITTSGSARKGRIAAMDEDAIAFEKGQPARIGRTEVAEIRITDYVGNGRHAGRLLGGVVGFLGGTIGLVAFGMKEDTQHKTRNGAIGVSLFFGGIAGGIVGGHYLGRLADKEVTAIRIIPEERPALRAERAPLLH